MSVGRQHRDARRPCRGAMLLTLQAIARLRGAARQTGSFYKHLAPNGANRRGSRVCVRCSFHADWATRPKAPATASPKPAGVRLSAGQRLSFRINTL